MSQRSKANAQLALGIIATLCVGACADTPAGSPPSDEPSSGATAEITNGETGEVRQIDISEEALRALLEPPADDGVSDKANCVFIRFCTTPGTASDITCDTDNQVCSSNARFNECNVDAQIVCGRTRPMRFDPGIPCPITGVPFCPPGFFLTRIS